MPQFAEVVIGLPIEGPFHYAIPESFDGQVQVGKRVWVPFGPRRLVGYVVGLTGRSPVATLKPIEAVIDPEPILSPELLKLTKWMSEYYCCSWGECLQTAIPQGLKSGKTEIKVRKPLAWPAVEAHPPLALTSAQQHAYAAICRALDARTPQVFLLYGVTSSGKTEVYLQAIAHALGEGKASIVLVPEISLTPQTIQRFRARFGDEVAILHSRLSDGERFLAWRSMREGRCRIVIGPRSALFSQFKAPLGLIVVDEEHETSYKQEEAPRYHAREVAIQRARIANALVVLGSATPSLESYFLAERATYQLLPLPERIDQRPLPVGRIVDMRNETVGRRAPPILSRHLEQQIKKHLERKQQVMLFLNRRGFATYPACQSCGYVTECKRCQVILTYHFAQKQLVCHYCNFKIAPPSICPTCQKGYMRYLGTGTEKIESEVHRLFPTSKIARMDTDVTTRRGSHQRILEAFAERRVDILIGTQMIAKGLDFPEVTLVGIVSADTALNIPDFRSGERTFQLLTQMAGRAGRGPEPGEVAIQTYVPHHPALTAATTHDYLGFYRQELEVRRQLRLPPFCHLTQILLRTSREAAVLEAGRALAEAFRDQAQAAQKRHPRLTVEVVGPAPDVHTKLRGQYRYNLYIKATDPNLLIDLVHRVLRHHRTFSKAHLTVDVDPL